MNSLPVILLLIPLAVTPVALAGKLWHSHKTTYYAVLAAPLVCLGLLAVSALVPIGQYPLHYTLGGWPTPVGITLKLGAPAWIGSVIAMTVATSVLLFTRWESRYESSFYFVFLMLLVAVTGTLLTDDLFNMFIFFEIASIASAILIAYSSNKRAIVASIRYLLISSLGAALFLVGVFFVYQETGVLSLGEIQQLLAIKGTCPPTIPLAVAALIAGVGLKVALVPFHTWLPEAHASAPHPVSAMLSGVMIETAFLVLWRITGTFEQQATMLIFWTLGPLTALGGAIWALSQSDSKRLLAFSSISHMGLIMIAFGVGGLPGSTSALYHLVNHSVFKSLLFLAVGVIILTRGKRGITVSAHAIRLRWPVLIALAVGVASSCGVPPLGGYASKEAILEALRPHRLLYLSASVTSIIGVAALLRVSKPVLSVWTRAKTPPGKLPDVNTRTKDNHTGTLYVSLYILAGLAVLLGLFPQFWLRNLARIMGLGYDVPASSLYSFTGLVNSAGTIGLGALLCFLSGKRPLKGAFSLIRGIKIGLGSALLLVIGGFLLIVIIYWSAGAFGTHF